MNKKQIITAAQLLALTLMVVVTIYGYIIGETTSASDMYTHAVLSLLLLNNLTRD